jgi:Flp pilus assembly protein TadG
MKPMSKLWRRARLSAFKLLRDRRGVAAIEFAMIVPVMLVLFFGTVEFSSGVAVDRKVTLIARTLSDVTSQSTSVSDTDIANFFTATCAIMYPYAGPPPCTTANNPTAAVISELFVDPSTLPLKAKVIWSKAYQGGVALTPDTTVSAVPGALLVSGSYLIYSQVSYNYVPAVNYLNMMGSGMTGITLSDVAYTRPRQSLCVIYPTPSPGVTKPCPTS